MGIWHSGVNQVQKLLGPSPPGILFLKLKRQWQREQCYCPQHISLWSSVPSASFCPFTKDTVAILEFLFVKKIPHIFVFLFPVLLMSVLEQDEPYSSVNALILFL